MGYVIKAFHSTGSYTEESLIKNKWCIQEYAIGESTEGTYCIHKQVATMALNFPDELLNPYMINIEGAQKSNMSYRNVRFNTHHNGGCMVPADGQTITVES